MIKTDIISGNVLRITAPDKLKADDFRQIAPQVDSIISRYGKIRLLIDASGFNGWENIEAFENHAGFVKNHQQKVDRIAVIAAHDWQHWLVGAVRVFLHPEVRAYDKRPRERGVAMDRRISAEAGNRAEIGVQQDSRMHLSSLCYCVHFRCIAGIMVRRR